MEDAGWVASVDAGLKVSAGDTVKLAMDASKIHIFDHQTEKTIIN